MFLQWRTACLLILQKLDWSLCILEQLNSWAGVSWIVVIFDMRAVYVTGTCSLRTHSGMPEIDDSFWCTFIFPSIGGQVEDVFPCEC